MKIEIEGTDGAGKTTALHYLNELLIGEGHKTLVTREVGSPLHPTLVKLREVVLSPTANLDGKTMELIFSAMRLEHDKLLSTVDKNTIILSDRGWLSHLAYTDHNVSEDFTENLYQKMIKNYTDMPDLIIYMRIDEDVALKRRTSRGEGVDVIEAKGSDFQRKVRHSFEKYINQGGLPSVITIDANQDIRGVEEQLRGVVGYLTNDLTHLFGG